ncbi:MAG: hypothetical protein HC846_11205 [Blastocatellia bacterium]|nr:hypothetical protein [Blastocatellia bacterium]
MLPSSLVSIILTQASARSKLNRVKPLAAAALTLNAVADEKDATRFGVNIIPFTLSATTLGDLRPGGRVNLEVDMLARYVQRLAEGCGRQGMNG